jgi:hypothetical protein
MAPAITSLSATGGCHAASTAANRYERQSCLTDDTRAGVGHPRRAMSANSAGPQRPGAEYRLCCFAILPIDRSRVGVGASGAWHWLGETSGK